VDDLARAYDMERRFFERLATSAEPFPFGTAYLDEEYRDRFVSNFLCADRDLERADVTALTGAADRILGGAGYAHRTVLVRSDEHGPRLAPGFADQGYRDERIVMMAHRREPDRGPTIDVAERRFTDVHAFILRTYRREPTLSTAVKTSFAQQHGKYERILGTRFFAGVIDGEIAGVCELWMDGPDALVEHVDTLEEYRGRGVARSVVLRAIAEASASGAERVFIAADDDDWPKELYARLGFDRLGRSWQFIRWPTTDG
jgi:GNAT superfamily N-acetyltransferase